MSFYVFHATYKPKSPQFTCVCGCQATGPRRKLLAPMPTPAQLVESVKNIEELARSVDVSAFPLPLRIDKVRRCGAIFCDCYGPEGSIHVYMRIKPRGDDELPGVRRDKDGFVELRTQTYVTGASFKEEGPVKSLEKIRVTIKNIVMHEVYEALLFQGQRIMDPHRDDRRPTDQPW